MEQKFSCYNSKNFIRMIANETHYWKCIHTSLYHTLHIVIVGDIIYNCNNLSINNFFNFLLNELKGIIQAI